MKSNSIQARLQSRIAYRAKHISFVSGQRQACKDCRNFIEYNNLKWLLKSLEHSQILDKDIMRTTYWETRSE
ncbi:MAG: hypothetical protein KGI54_16360 [Pseudomonadota bacterium]|nr:hypothetical protein [Pseudomonadota bacterium]